MMRDLETLARRIESRLDLPEPVTGVVPLSAGHSNETYLLHGPGIVLRTPPAGTGLLPPYDMGRQHDLMAEVGAAAPWLPVPEVYGWSADESVIGVPYYLCQLMPGEAFEYTAPAWLTDATPGFRRRLCRQWIGSVASIHRIQPLGSGGPVRRPEEVYQGWRDLTLTDIAAVGETMAAEGRAITAIFDEILGRALPRSGSPTPVHGDPKIGNTMWLDGRLTALLDWEMAFNGEPLCDLAYILHWFPADPRINEMGLPSYDYFTLPGMFSRDEVISVWEHGTGRDARGVELYEIAEAAKLCSIIFHGAAAYEAGLIDDPRLAPWLQVAQLYRERAAKLLAAVGPSAEKGKKC
jgi:aminoglycoside phosphotransferase (APT) family kinase protein